MRRLNELAQAVSGEVTHSPQLEISGAGRIASASDSAITFVTSEAHFQKFLDGSAAAAVVARALRESLAQEANLASATDTKPLILVDDVETAFVKIAKLFLPPVIRKPAGIHPQATVSPSATIGTDVTIHAGAVIMDGASIGDRSTVFPNVTVMEACQIGCDTQIFPGAVLYENTIVGDRVILHAGVVLGAYGFGYKSESGTHELSVQLGNVVIEDDVELGANTTVDRGTYDSTYIRRGSKLDNMVMIGHNCDIGEDNLLCSQVGIAGSCDVGNGVVMGGQVGVGDHLNIGSGSMIMAKTGLMHDVEPNAAMFGIPARPARRHMQIQAVSSKLPELRKELKALSRAFKELKESQEADTPATDSNEDRKAA